jgi:hypothetical protein
MTIAQMDFTSFDGRPLTLAFYIAEHAISGKTTVGFGVSHDPNNLAGDVIESIDQSPIEVIQKMRETLDELERSLTPAPP